jgi:hypothetical protein
MRHFSIRNLMACVLVSAVGLAALRNASDLWAGMMLLIALAAVGVAVLGAVILRGWDRHWWAGFAFFGGGYLVLTLAPGFSTEVGPRLVTAMALDHLYSQFLAVSTEGRLPQILRWQHATALAQVDQLRAANRGPGDRELDSALRILINLESQLRGAADQRDFIRVGHALFALLAGLVGGTVAVWFYARRDRAEAAAG